MNSIEFPSKDFIAMSNRMRDMQNVPDPWSRVVPEAIPKALEVGIDATLAERGTRYGEFGEHARITQNMKRAMQDSPNWATLSDDMKEALEMVAHKVGRILNGDPKYHDSWYDMIGYTKLVADKLLSGV